MNVHDYKDLIGYAAAVLTTVAFVPQVLHTWRTRSVDDVSFGMYLAFTTGIGLWLIYGILENSWPLILANTPTFALALSILAMKVRYGGRRMDPN